MPEFERYGILNLLVLIAIWRIWRLMQQGTYRPERLEELLSQRGLANQVLAGRLQSLISHSWQLYPVGFLFGLGRSNESSRLVQHV
jgi:nickel/cobalt transporter (NiCoT) family protein